eukprot:3096833-Rhodomonas_salina.1
MAGAVVESRCATWSVVELPAPRYNLQAPCVSVRLAPEPERGREGCKANEKEEGRWRGEQGLV